MEATSTPTSSHPSLMPVKDENFLSIACQGPLLRTTEMVDDRLQITLVKDQHLDNFVVRMIEVKDIKVKSNSDLLFSFIWYRNNNSFLIEVIARVSPCLSSTMVNKISSGHQCYPIRRENSYRTHGTKLKSEIWSEETEMSILNWTLNTIQLKLIIYEGILFWTTFHS